MSLKTIRKRSVRICFVLDRVDDPHDLSFAAHHIHDSVHKVLHEIHLSKQVTVHNDLGNISFQCTVKEPKNLQELVDVMVKAKQEKQNVRAVGAFHAWS
jgi:hypothetical protein